MRYIFLPVLLTIVPFADEALIIRVSRKTNEIYIFACVINYCPIC